MNKDLVKQSNGNAFVSARMVLVSKKKLMQVTKVLRQKSTFNHIFFITLIIYPIDLPQIPQKIIPLPVCFI